jgi:hypothetical protein
MSRLIVIASAFLLSLGLLAQEVAPDVQAKFLKTLVSATGQFGLACNNDPVLKKSLEGAGVSVAPGFKLAWAATEAEVKTLKADGRLVLVPKVQWLKLGGGIAIVEDEGKPTFVIHMANAKASGLAIPDAIIKIAKKI